MGGKAKQSQRTKNNARPSSSGRSAELLNNVDGPWNTNAGGKISTLFPTLTTPIIDQGLTAEFALCIRKLNKKDPITKTKALQELVELVNNSKVDEVAAALPSWAHFYKILAVDTDCKVRESAQLCHATIARACGRRLAPLLRQLVPAWLQAQYDEHAPAQTHAANSLKATFPENKLPEVISFCKAEVFVHFLDNLVGNGDKSILNRIDDPEERLLQQQRLTCSSLQGLRFLILHLPQSHRAWLWDALAPLLAHSAFWKLPQHKQPQVRGAWYGAVGAAIEVFGAQFGAAHGARCARMLLASSPAQHAAVAHQLWACLLSLMFSVDDWHKWLDKKDLLTKRILEMLEQGGWGDARRLSDMLLPLLAHLPRDMLDKHFYEAFFNAFYKGLDNKNILSSKSERQHWITSLSECLRYLSIQPFDYVVEVATSVHRTWLKKVLHLQHDTQLRKNLIKYSAASMTSLVKYWLKQSKQPNGEKYDQLVRNFWQNIASTVLAQIENPLESEKIALIIDGHILLLQTLKTSFLTPVKKTQSIKFDGDTPTAAEAKSAPEQEIDPVLIERYKHNLNEAVEKVCCGHFEFADKTEATEVILTSLITILNDFDSKSLYLAVAKHFNCSGVYEFYEKVLRRWMQIDTMRCKAVVDVIFIVLQHLTEEEQDAVLASFDQFPCGAVEWCVSSALGLRAQWACTRRWLRSACVRAVLLTLARRLLHKQCPRARNLLFVSLCLDARGPDMIIGPETASAIAEVVSSALKTVLEPAADPVALQHCCGVGAHLATALADHAGVDHYGALILNLFRITLAVPRGDPRLSPASWTEVASAVHDGLQALPAPARSRARAEAAGDIHARLYTLVDCIDIATLSHVTSLCPQLLREVDDPAPPADAAEIRDFTKQLFDLKPEPADKLIETSALRYDCIVGKLNCPFEDGNEHIKAIAETSNDVPEELTKDNFVPYANRLLFRAMYLRTILLHKGGGDAEDDEDDEGDEKDKKDEKDEKKNKTWCNQLLAHEYLQGEFCNLLREYMVVNSLHEGFGFWPQHDLIHQTKSKLDDIVDEIIAETSEEVRSRILEKLTEHAAAEGFYRAYALGFFEHKVDMWQEPKIPSLADNFDIADLNDIITGNGYIHSLQASHRGLEDADRALQSEFAAMARSVLCAYWPLVRDEHFVSEIVRCAAACDIDYLIQFYHTHQHLTLHKKSISELSWPCAVAEACVASCTAAALRRGGWEAPARHWDFANVQLCTLVHSLANATDKFGCAKVAVLARATFALYRFTERFVSQIRAESERRQPPEHIFNLTGEWRDVFAPALNKDIFAILVYLLDEKTTLKMSCGMVQVIAAVGGAAAQVQWALLEPARRAAYPLAALVRACAARLARPGPPALHALAYRALNALAQPLADHTDSVLAEWGLGGSEEGEDRARPQLPVEWFQPHLTQALELAACALAAHTVGEDSCEMQPGSDAHGVALGCLLLLEALHALARRARGDLPHHYTQAYRENQYAEQLLPIALKLIPVDLLKLAQQSSNAPMPPHYADAFQNAPDWTPDDPRWWNSVGLIACRSIYSMVGGFGAGGARGWSGAAPRPCARALSRLAAAYLTPVLVRRQLELLLRRKAELEDTEVTVHWGTNEAVMVYRIEDRPVELQIRFEADFPLSLPRVAAPKVRPAVTTSWIAMYITYQNGTVLNACKLWTEAINSKVESSPPCFVCYCRLHPATGHLPGVRCHQCRNRFHTACLHKWFVSSHKSNCPLCRSNF